MIGRIAILLLFSTFAFPVHAGQTIIRETDSGYEVEYIPDQEDAKATEAQKEQEEAEATKKRQTEEKNAARRAKSETRKARERAEEGNE